MYWLDITILVLLGLGAGLGFWSGLLWQVARVLSLGLSLYAAVLLNEPATQLLDEAVRGIDPHIAQGAAYVAVFLGVYLTLFICTRLLHTTIKATQLDLIDRLLGALLGSAKMAALVAVVCMALASVSFPQAQEWMNESKLAPLFARGTEAGLELIPEEYRSRVSEGLQQIRDTMQPGASRRVAEAPAGDQAAAVSE
jgi:uncharacterized membrane protein required for colicin V production